jgi:uncharacterized protein YndB with AHSA1/START domain
MSSIQTEIVVDATPDRAFRMFTEKMATWWPAEHHIAKAAMKTVVMERRANGRWFEVGIDGSETNWGRVLVWDPPRRVVLAWQLTAEWQFDSKFETEVEVKFVPAGKSQTRVTLEHRNLERYGAKEEGVRKAVGSEGGWALTLKNFASAVAQQPAAV